MTRASNTVTGMVTRYLEGDVVLRDALSRGLVSMRQAARWLVQAQGWCDVEVEAVVSALRRHGPEPGEDAFAEARAMLAVGHVNTRSRVCAVQLANTPEVRGGLAGLVSTVDVTKGESLRLISSERGLRLFIDERNLGRVVQALGPSNVTVTEQHLTEVGVVLPASAQGTPGILALLCSRLALHGISVEAVFDGVSHVLLLVDDEDAPTAYAVVTRLTASAFRPP